jgi:hypothetical protein
VQTKLKQKGKGKGGTNGEKPKCTNPKCGKVGHTIQNCWAEGGGAEGKGPKAKTNNAKPSDAKPAKAKAKIAHIDESPIEEISPSFFPVLALREVMRRFILPPRLMGNSLGMLGY